MTSACTYLSDYLLTCTQTPVSSCTHERSNIHPPRTVAPPACPRKGVGSLRPPFPDPAGRDSLQAGEDTLPAS